MTDFSLLVLDECHHVARGKHAYRVLMSLYLDIKCAPVIGFHTLPQVCNRKADRHGDEEIYIYSSLLLLLLLTVATDLGAIGSHVNVFSELCTSVQWADSSCMRIFQAEMYANSHHQKNHTISVVIGTVDLYHFTTL